MRKEKVDGVQAFCEHIDSRLDAIERLINISLMSSIIEYIDDVNENVPASRLNNNSLKDVLRENDLIIEKEEPFGEKIVVYLKSEKK